MHDAGIVGLSLNGINFKIDGESATYDVRSQERESIVGAMGRVGRQTKGRIPFIQVTALLDQTQRSSDLDISDGKVELTLQDRVVSLANADLVASVEVDASKNSVQVRFEGNTGREVL